MGDYSVSISRAGDFVRAHVEGNFISTQHALTAWIRIAAQLADVPRPKLLIVRGPGSMAIGPALAEIVLAIRDLAPPGMRAAMVADDEHWNNVINHVASSRAIAYRAFRTEAEARAYLEAPDP